MAKEASKLGDEGGTKNLEGAAYNGPGRAQEVQQKKPKKDCNSHKYSWGNGDKGGKVRGKKVCSAERKKRRVQTGLD